VIKKEEYEVTPSGEKRKNDVDTTSDSKKLRVSHKVYYR
jgi:hypothetical protein